MTNYSDYLTTVEELVHLKESLSSEGDAIRARRQEAQQQGSTLVRTAEREAQKMRESFRIVESRARSFGKRYPDVVATPLTPPSSVDQCVVMIRRTERELDSIDAAESWLSRARSQLTQAQFASQFSNSEVPLSPIPTQSPPKSDSAPEIEGRRNVAWYWWAGGIAALAGLAGMFASLL